MLSLASRLARPVVASRHVLRQSLFLSTTTTSNLIINAVGQDRLGIVSDITGMVIDVGGNVGDSQAAKLGQHFSLMMLVTVPSNKTDVLKATLSNMKDMNATVFPAVEENSWTPKTAYSGYFTLEGADNPGIVHIMTTALAQHGLNIDKMETDQEIAPHGGTVLFRMRGLAVAYEPLAASFDANTIRQELQELGGSLNCDVDLQEMDDDSSSGVFYGG